MYVDFWVLADSPRQSLVSEDNHVAARKRHQWTSVHSHYALMGGFAVESAPKGDMFLPGNPSRLILTPAAIRFLADKEPALIPNISKEHIHDKSKASGLAKALVCMQASWFCIQCVARLANDMAISLLELNTFAHAMCTLLIYLLWWHKPLDVEEPTVIQGDNAGAVFAAMAMLDCAQRDPRKSNQGFMRTKGYCSITHDMDAVPPDETVDEILQSLGTSHRPSDATIKSHAEARQQGTVTILSIKDFSPYK